jgi:ketosteroid isomerase-like protein
MDDNVAVVRAAYAAFGRGDIPAILELLHDDIAWSAPRSLPQGGTFAGKDGAVQFFQGIGAAWDGLKIDVEATGEIENGLVIGVLTGSGNLRAGGVARYGGVHVFTVESGKIKRFREYVDLDRPIST